MQQRFGRMALITGIACGALVAGTGQAKAPVPTSPAYDVRERSIASLRADLDGGRVTSAALVAAYRARIAQFDPRLHAVLALNPQAMAQALAADKARAAAKARVAGRGPSRPLEGIPILVKDNIETADPVATTAGSLALARNVTGRDAPLVARLRAAGAIVLGKTNLSEWANIRSSHSVSGWSAMGGQTRNPYDPRRSPCGSSAGSGSAAAASLAAAAIGTETDGSITCPASVAGLVGFKPTVGLVSRSRIVPISHSQDTAGPMARSVTDAALLLAGMADASGAADPADPATLTAAAAAANRAFVAALRPDALNGVRIGVLRFATGAHPGTDAAFETALAALRSAGATLVDITKFPGDDDELGALENTVLMTELKADLVAYLATTDPERVPTRTLADLIAFNRAHAASELAPFGQELFLEAEATRGLDDPAYRTAAAEARRRAGPEGIDRLLAETGTQVLVAPTLGPAGLIDPVLKDHFVGGGAGSLPAVAGYPHLTVPMGLVDGLPVGLSFIGPAWSDAAILGYGYAYEQASHARRAP